MAVSRPVAQIVALLCIFGGCIVNNVFLEHIINLRSSVGTALTFCQFCTVSLYASLRYLTSSRPKDSAKVPTRRWLQMVLIFFVVSVMNNASLGFSIPMPLHMVFRAGSLAVSMVTSALLLNRRYSSRELIGGVCVQIGIILVTMLQYSHLKEGETTPEIEEADTEQAERSELFLSVASIAYIGPMVEYIDVVFSSAVFRYFIGMTMLVLTISLSSYLGILQERVYSEYGRQPVRAMLFTHMYSIPVFLIMGPMWIPELLMWDSELWWLVLGNCISQVVCIQGVYSLTSLTSSLTMTLAITLRKFMSLVFSVIYFANYWTHSYSLSTLLVFAGTFLYSYKPAEKKEKAE